MKTKGLNLRMAKLHREAGEQLDRRARVRRVCGMIAMGVLWAIASLVITDLLV
jgi:hypothetical protein